MTTMNEQVCQCPQTGYIHFYTHDTLDDGAYLYCVNALKRATSISTKGEDYDNQKN